MPHFRGNIGEMHHFCLSLEILGRHVPPGPSSYSGSGYLLQCVNTFSLTILAIKLINFCNTFLYNRAKKRLKADRGLWVIDELTSRRHQNTLQGCLRILCHGFHIGYSKILRVPNPSCQQIAWSNVQISTGSTEQDLKNPRVPGTLGTRPKDTPALMLTKQVLTNCY